MVNPDRLIKSVSYKWSENKINKSDIYSKIQHEQGYLTLSDYSPINPRIFHLELSSYCNMDCIMCPRGKKPFWTRENYHLSFSLIKKMYQRGDFSGTKSLELFLAGEPTLNPEFEKITKYLSEKGIYLSTAINGKTNDCREHAKMVLRSGLDYVTIDVESLEKETYEKIRVGGNYYQLIAFINILFEEMYNNKDKKLPIICFQMVEMDENKDEFPAFRENARKLLFPEKCKEFLDNLCLEDKILFRTVFLDTLGGNIKLDDLNLKRVGAFEPCISLWYGVAVLADGTVVPCDRDLNGNYSLGNLNDSRLHDLFNGERMRKYRRANMMNFTEEDREGIPENCINCQERNLQNMRFIPWLVNNMWDGEKPI